MERNFLLTFTLICIVVAGVGGQYPITSPTKAPTFTSPTASPAKTPAFSPLESPKSSFPISAPPLPTPEVDTSAPVASPISGVSAPAPSKSKKHQNAPAPTLGLGSSPKPPSEAPGLNSDVFSPGPATSADYESGAESRRNVAVGAAATALAVLVIAF